MKIVFDAGLAGERELPITSVTADGISLSALWETTDLTQAAGLELTGLRGMAFTTLEVLDGQTQIPIIGSYATVSSASTSYRRGAYVVQLLCVPAEVS